MRVRIAIVLLQILLPPACLGLCQERQLPLSPQTGSTESSYNSLAKALQTIQEELKQIAEDLSTIDARILHESPKGRDQTTSTSLGVHEVLKNEHPPTLIRDFLNASQDRLRFESCLKSAKLYRNLATEIFGTHLSGTGPPPLGDAFAQTAQLLFLSRMIPELEIQYGQLSIPAKGRPDSERAELWQRLWEALRQDDKLLLGKLRSLCSAAGESPNQFAARVLSQAQKTSPSAAARIVESMSILNPAADVWRLAEIPGINPVFLSALECERQAMSSVPASAFPAASLQALKCRASNGSAQAFTAHPPPSIDSSSRAPASAPDEIPRGQDIFRMLTEKELQDLQNQDSKVDTVPSAPSQTPGFGVSNTPVKRPKIPSWWIRCACPSDHPDAGIVFEGVRWHAPVLQCPNPELRRLEVK